MKKFEQQLDKALGHGDHAPPAPGKQAPKLSDDPPVPDYPDGPNYVDPLKKQPGTEILVTGAADIINMPIAPLRNGQETIRRMATSLDPCKEANGVKAYRAQQDKD